MGTSTPNLQLWKPAPGDNVNVTTDIDNNWDKVDTAVQNLNVPPTCIARMTGNFNISANADVFAGAGWVATEDPTNMLTVGATPGTTLITIAKAGKYLISYVANNDPASGSTANYITLNSADINQSRARDSRGASTAGGDGTWLHAWKEYRLNVNDKLYWGTWSSVACTSYQLKFGVAAEIEVRLVTQ